MAWFQLSMRLIVDAADVVRSHGTTALGNLIVVGWKLFLVADSIIFPVGSYIAGVVALEWRSALEHIHAGLSRYQNEAFPDNLEIKSARQREDKKVKKKLRRRRELILVNAQTLHH